MSFKEDRIIKMMKREIMTSVVNGEIKDKRIPSLFTITKVTLSKDKHYAHIYITLDGDETERKTAVIGLNSAKGFIQHILAEKLDLRFTPKLEFRYDNTAEKANSVDDILKRIAEESSENDDQTQI